MRSSSGWDRTRYEPTRPADGPSWAGCAAILILLLVTAGLSLFLGDAKNSIVSGVILLVSVGLGFSNELGPLWLLGMAGVYLVLVEVAKRWFYPRAAQQRVPTRPAGMRRRGRTHHIARRAARFSTAKAGPLLHTRGPGRRRGETGHKGPHIPWVPDR